MSRREAAPTPGLVPLKFMDTQRFQGQIGPHGSSLHLFIIIYVALYDLHIFTYDLQEFAMLEVLGLSHGQGNGSDKQRLRQVFRSIPKMRPFPFQVSQA